MGCSETQHTSGRGIAQATSGRPALDDALEPPHLQRTWVSFAGSDFLEWEMPWVCVD